jgi:hypothetical protein
MNFSSPEKVASVIQTLKDAENRRAPNRALINTLFNGAPPYTKSEADENKIQWNVNWGEGADLLLQGREQLENAHLSTDFAFTIRVPDAPKSKVRSYGHKLTQKVNKLLRSSLPYFHTQRSKWGSVILHGPGSQMWDDCYVWKPSFVGIDDLLIPTDTELTYENLNHFARRRRMTPGQLFRKTFGLPADKRDPGWNLKVVASILDSYRDINQNQNSWNWFDNPEKMAELWKQNVMYYETDAVPVIHMWDFCHQEDGESTPCWYRKILLDRDWIGVHMSSVASNPMAYVYNSEKPYAENINQVLHTQFIDGNNVPPFMYHSCRGLGQRLHDIIHALNRFRCQTIQKGFEEMLQLFRVTDPADWMRLVKLGTEGGDAHAALSRLSLEQRRIDLTAADGVDADAPSGIVERHRLRQHADGALAGAVGSRREVAH